MYSPTFVLSAFNGDLDWDLSARIMTILLDALTSIDIEVMRAFPGFPTLYASGTRYFAEKDWEGPWLDALVVATTRAADCKSLVAYRVAELRLQGIAAKAEFARLLLPTGKQWIHIFVRYPDGRFEDPSRLLGMT